LFAGGYNCRLTTFPTRLAHGLFCAIPKSKKIQLNLMKYATNVHMNKTHTSPQKRDNA